MDLDHTTHKQMVTIYFLRTEESLSLVSASPARAVRFRENVKNVTPRVFIVTLGIFIASSFFLILMTEWENLVKIEN